MLNSRFHVAYEIEREYWRSIPLVSTFEEYVKRFKEGCIYAGGNASHEVISSIIGESEHVMCVFPMGAEIDFVISSDPETHERTLYIYIDRKEGGKPYVFGIPLNIFTKIEIEEPTTAFGKLVINPEKNTIATDIQVEAGRVLFVVDRSNRGLKISIWP